MTPLRFALTTLLVALTGSVQAHFIWLEIPPGPESTVFMRFAEAPLEPTPARLQALCAPMAVSTPDGAALSFQDGDEKRVASMSDGADVITGHLEYGVMDRGEDNVYLLTYHAKGARSLEAAATATDLGVDIRATISGNELRIGVFFQGKPYEGSELVLDLPNAPEQLKVKTDAQGFVTTPVEPGGWVGIRAMVPETASGTREDKSYEQVRHYGTLTFPLPTL